VIPDKRPVRGPLASITPEFVQVRRTPEDALFNSLMEQFHLRLLRRLDQLYLKRPFFGSRKMAVELAINQKRAQRLMRNAKHNLSRPAPGREVYPYLLRGVAIKRPITSGAPILRTFRCAVAFSTWSR
jgi:hypothetical protein